MQRDVQSVQETAADTSPRRDFIMLTASALAGVGGIAVLWPLIDSMNPAADVRALATVELDLSPIEVGQRVTISWQGRPVFIDHRSEAAIDSARDVEVEDLPDPQSDAERVQQPEWLVVVGICTHLGCIPLGQKSGDSRGDYGGWFCPCHGSHYDTSGRIRKGPAPKNLTVRPAPKNLTVPPYSINEEGVLRIG